MLSINNRLWLCWFDLNESGFDDDVATISCMCQSNQKVSWKMKDNMEGVCMYIFLRRNIDGNTQQNLGLITSTLKKYSNSSKKLPNEHGLALYSNVNFCGEMSSIIFYAKK